jgi:hypothetical protein
MILHEACHELFANYPLAVKAFDGSGTVRSIVLMLRDDDDLRFFKLRQDRKEGGLVYSLCPWRAEAAVDSAADCSATIPEMTAAVTYGIPMPRDGSLFGWNGGDAITALVPVYTEYSPDCPQPRWAVMPLAGILEVQWPPITSERFFGHWFWELHQDGSIIILDALIAGTPGTVFWADAQAILGSDCCTVARDIESPEGPVLQRGRYVYCDALRTGKPVPSLSVLLADPSKIDLAPRFQSRRDNDGGPQPT